MAADSRIPAARCRAALSPLALSFRAPRRGSSAGQLHGKGVRCRRASTSTLAPGAPRGGGLRFEPDANIFSPESGTLAYSDGTLLEGVLAAPLFWAGVTPILIYNLLLFAGFVSSGLAMFVLVRYLTRNANAALVAAAIFTLAPYRIEHFMHLELQWTAWMPLAFWAVHRAVDARTWRYGAKVSHNSR